MLNFNRCNRCNRRIDCRQDNCDSCFAGREFGEFGRESIADRDCGCEPIDRQEFRCDKDQHVRKHQHIVKHQHDIIDEYDVIHEHEYNYYDVVKEREVVKENNFCKHEPNYCKEDRDCDCDCNNRRNRRCFR